MGNKVVAGIDIGGTHTSIALVNEIGNVLIDVKDADLKSEFKTSDYKEFDQYIEKIGQTIKELIGDSGEYELKGIGIGAPNSNRKTGCIDNAVNLPPHWGEAPINAKLAKIFPNAEIVLDNDANAVAFYKKVFAKESEFLLVTLGTGLGSGIVVANNMIVGHDGLAGELGHIIAIQNGRMCNCGRRGCLETYASATGIRRTVLELICNWPEKYDNNGASDKKYISPLRDICFNKLAAVDIYNAACNGDSIAKEAFEITGKILGKSIADVVALTSPSKIFLYGGLAKAGDMLLKPTVEAFEENLLFVYKMDGNKNGAPKAKISIIDNEEAAVLGAAALVWDEINKK